MGQLMLWAEYLIDTCSILAQKSDRAFKRKMFKSGWEYIDLCIMKGKIVTCSEIEHEIKDSDILQWLHEKQCSILEIDDEIQKNVRMIVTEHPGMINFTNNGNNSSSGDVFLIATAISHKLSIITEESKDRRDKIPFICRSYNIPTYNVSDFWEREGLVF